MTALPAYLTYFIYDKENDKYLNRQQIGLFKEMGKNWEDFLKIQIKVG